MSDTTEQVIESAAPPELQAKAEKMGWIPPTRYKGDPERFVDAEEYVARGEQILPIIRSQNQRLQAEVEALRNGQAQTQEALQRAEQALKEVNERHTVATQKAVEQARKDLKARLKEAHDNGDNEAIAEITGMMVELRDAAPPEGKKEEQKAPPPPQVDPVALAEIKAWNAENPWYGTDKRKTALALGIAQELRDNGSTLTGRDFFEKVREELDTMLGGRQEGSAGKVEGARSSGGGGTGSKGKGYASLPAEARAACDADAKNFVGEGKRYKDLASWQKRYAELYFED